jgi:hypothetical protein
MDELFTASSAPAEPTALTPSGLFSILLLCMREDTMAEREGVAFDLSVTSVIDTASEEILRRTEANARAVLRAF